MTCAVYGTVCFICTDEQYELVEINSTFSILYEFYVHISYLGANFARRLSVTFQSQFTLEHCPDGFMQSL